MKPLAYSRALDVDDAVAQVSREGGGAFLAGGTTEVDLLRAGVAHHDHLVEVVSTLGVNGVGEIGMVGVAAAIANAVFHATGRRVRELPLAPELVMDPPSAGR